LLVVAIAFGLWQPEVLTTSIDSIVNPIEERMKSDNSATIAPAEEAPVQDIILDNNIDTTIDTPIDDVITDDQTLN
jgi:hypothetical protein